MDKFVHGQGIVRFRWTEYDTGKPSDPATGKPPIKHEGEAQVGWKAGRFMHKEGADSSRTTKGARNCYRWKKTAVRLRRRRLKGQVR